MKEKNIYVLTMMYGYHRSVVGMRKFSWFMCERAGYQAPVSLMVHCTTDEIFCHSYIWRHKELKPAINQCWIKHYEEL